MNSTEKPTAMLSEEHQSILKVINALIKECDALEQKKELDKDFFEKAIDFIRNFADKFHHAKEEDILFIELCKDEVQMHCNPIPQMLHEHDLGRNFVKGMEQGLNENNKAKVIENARGYIQLLQEHIDKEDNILYPMADEALNPEIQKTILEKFKQAEHKRFTEGTKEKYIALADEFEKIN
ncbi:MAG: hemerythrin domain-containing protein [Candidatus Woesearchaeota archaeon]|nr:hemerythrin domain-containing protein [Candidatus Woesearchaeota archaeon]MDP7622674.1 hemerythrin domain-containing protein [Candidatus Woesearchaeota archaeon]HJN57235.1 hemerythrin domain-containing protein [Candidatus Woesearchaeota archaeon]